MDQQNRIKLEYALGFHKAGRFQEAKTLYKEVLILEPQNSDALHLLGLICLEEKSFETAVEYIQQAIKIEPRVNFYISLAKVYQAKNQVEEVINCYKKALELNPEQFELYDILGNIYYNQNNYDEAEKYFKKALELKPDSAGTYYNLGNACYNQSKLSEAIRNYITAIEIKPDYTEAYANLGTVYNYQNKLKEATECYFKALELNPDYLMPYKTLIPAVLIQKDFDTGWKLYKEFRQKNARQLGIPESAFIVQWDGSSLVDKTIYIRPEQGIGDMIFSARYLPVLYSMGAKVKCRPQGGLEELFRQNDLKAEIIYDSIAEDNIEFDFFCSSYYLLAVLNINTENIPYPEGYLKADPEKVKLYKEKYFNNDCFKLGIVWQGNPGFKNDRSRSLKPEHFYKFAELPNLKVYSLQKGKAEKQLESMPDGVEIVNLGETFNDFSDTAAAIENLDLVICCDTSITHLTGALGKPGWVLIPFSPDWRWFLNEEKCPLL